jgi:hypothetical protein
METLPAILWEGQISQPRETSSQRALGLIPPRGEETLLSLGIRDSELGPIPDKDIPAGKGESGLASVNSRREITQTLGMAFCPPSGPGLLSPHQL